MLKLDTGGILGACPFITISISQTFHSGVAISHFARIGVFISQLIRYAKPCPSYIVRIFPQGCKCMYSWNIIVGMTMTSCLQRKSRERGPGGGGVVIPEVESVNMV